MCGIYGVYSLNVSNTKNADNFKKMGNLLQHRGPDDEGVWSDSSISLGQKRLSIIDLSTGHQPMSNEDRTVWITYNGEVYNYLELKGELLKSGHIFSTTSDTEVIIHLYEEFGLEFANKLNGMFALAIWDVKLKRLVLLRDRVGIKPLYYALRGKELIFASEIKSILAYIEGKPEANINAVREYFTYGYVVNEETMFKGVYKLLPGHMLIYERDSYRIKKYWDMKFNSGNIREEEYYVQKVKDMFSESVRLQLRSDVPLGVFLSGGIDSSTVVAFVNSMVKDKIKTFSAVFNNVAGFSEAQYSRLVAKYFNTDHYEVDVSPLEFRDFIKDFVRFHEEPTIDASGIPLYYVAKLAKKHVKVMLSGEGSDEIFAGYPIYKYIKLMEQYRRLPHRLRQTFFNTILSRLNLNGKGKKFVMLASLPLEERYYGFRSYDLKNNQRFLSEDFFRETDISQTEGYFSQLYENVKGENFLNKLLYIDTKTWLPEDILIKSDRMSMAASIELRVPFLDHNLVQFVADMPGGFKLRGTTGKYILRKAVEKMLPREIIKRKKIGFPVPLSDLLRNELREYVEENLSLSQLRKRGYFNSEFVRDSIRNHMEGKEDNNKIIWPILILELWHQVFID